MTAQRGEGAAQKKMALYQPGLAADRCLVCRGRLEQPSRPMMRRSDLQQVQSLHYRLRRHWRRILAVSYLAIDEDVAAEQLHAARRPFLQVHDAARHTGCT